MHLTSLKTRDLASRVVAALAVLALLWAPVEADARGAAQEEPQEPIEALGRALGMTPAEVEALGLSPEEVQNLLAGFTDETVVVGSRAQPRTVTASPVPVDVLSTADLTREPGEVPPPLGLQEVVRHGGEHDVMVPARERAAFEVFQPEVGLQRRTDEGERNERRTA